ncbi:uncharacterized protein LOC108806944 isoform X1 [Raphanus sativus]|uniref:Uncharacterized protein LOC108806944 isoform X1 n=1 Tax=Raphanus sativus TaxID=3726 RepID=A0A6J0JGA5_RAPSA|nr:uncharacterized protein LOC108806944 isoform X1 [Raphanus sativus]XP_056845470.1 uncharacterized protein LOC108806944 isoform X1 [Raphanus sativus]XP_056845471.1 uncharacterized protein LOC108806944 isoform X1 [Raphanus sativus]XP_056845472.1 uncharacterized protein LOC108806944 isoform X1 [Raphanus sativus]
MGVNMVLVEEKYIVSLVDHSLRLIIPLFGHLNTLLREGAVYELSDFDERNTAADFILCYEEMQPFVQTLPLVILQKEIVLSKLVSGLHMKVDCCFIQRSFGQLYSPTAIHVPKAALNELNDEHGLGCCE